MKEYLANGNVVKLECQRTVLMGVEYLVNHCGATKSKYSPIQQIWIAAKGVCKVAVVIQHYLSESRWHKGRGSLIPRFAHCAIGKRRNDEP